MKKYAEYFEKCCLREFKNENEEKVKEFSEDDFWHLVKINGGDTWEACIEFQWRKGFTFSSEKEYISYEPFIEVVSVNDLIKAFGEESIFNMDGKSTSFGELFENENDFKWLDEDMCFDDWNLQKYEDGLVNVYDKQCNEFRFESNISKEEVLADMLYRELDIYIDNEDYQEVIQEEGNADSIRKKIIYLLDLAKKYNVYDSEQEKRYIDYSKEMDKYEKEYQDNQEELEV